MRVGIACIVEGFGEMEAVPILIRRIAQELDSRLDVHIPQPIRRPKSKLLKETELENAVEVAARKLDGKGGVLVVLDSDDDCPASRGPELVRRARVARADIPLGLVLAKCEFESWFLAAAESLRGKRRLPHDIVSAPDPEAVRGAKEWLRRRVTGGMTYSEVVDQPALVACLDLQAARRADSFDKCYREIVSVLRKLMEGPSLLMK